MPNPLDALKKAQSIGPVTPGNRFNIPADSIKRGEMVALPGEGAIGALKGLYQKSGIIPEVMESMYQRANPVFKRLQDAGMFAGDRTAGAAASAGSRAVQSAPRAIPNLASEASYRAAPVRETLGEINPEFTPMGGEGLFNVGKEAVQGLIDPAVKAYLRIMSTMGR